MAKNTPEDFLKLQTEALRMSTAAAAKTMEGFQKLATLNMQTAKASLDQANEQIRALLAVRDAKTLTELVTSYTKPSPEKFTAYAKAVYAISSETSTELRALVEKQIADSNAQLVEAIENLAKNAPPGSEGAFAFVRQSLTAANKAYEQVNTATKKFVETAAAAGGAKKR